MEVGWERGDDGAWGHCGGRLRRGRGRAVGVRGGGDGGGVAVASGV